MIGREGDGVEVVGGEEWGVEKELGRGGRREKEKGEWGDTCMNPVPSSAVVLGVCTCVEGQEG